MRRPLVLISCGIALAGAVASSAVAGEDRRDASPRVPDRIEELQQDLDSLTEDVEDLQEPIEEFELFEQCMYVIGVTQYGRRDGSAGYVFRRGGISRRPALALDIRGFDAPQWQFLAFPAEEPPSIECNEDAGEEDSDD